MSKVSVCVATYEGESYILQQLRSLRKQTREIDEVILFDDRSKDSTQAYVQAYIQKHALPWKFYIQESNVGYIRNFASALKKCSGDFIFLCDQDDLWELDKVERMVKLFEEHEEIQCINSSFTYIDAQNNVLPQEDQATNYGMLWNRVEAHSFVPIAFEEILYHNIAMGCTMAFRSSLKDIYLTHSSFQAPHDWEINRIAAIQNGLYFYQEKLMRYRIHENNTVGNDNVNGRSHKKRIKNAWTMFSYSESYSSYVTILNDEQKQRCHHVHQLCEKRYALLQYKKKLNWFKLLLHIKDYRKMVSMKGMLADFINA